MDIDKINSLLKLLNPLTTFQNPQIHLLSICMHLYHRELILEEKCDIAPGHKNKQYICQLAECIQLSPVQATKTHLVDSISLHSNIKKRTVLPTERVIVTFCPILISQNYLSITIKVFTFPLLYVFSVTLTY